MVFWIFPQKVSVGLPEKEEVTWGREKGAWKGWTLAVLGRMWSKQSAHCALLRFSCLFCTCGYTIALSVGLRPAGGSLEISARLSVADDVVSVGSGNCCVCCV